MRDSPPAAKAPDPKRKQIGEAPLLHRDLGASILGSMIALPQRNSHVPKQAAFWGLLSDEEKNQFLRGAAISIKRRMTDDLQKYVLARLEEVDKISELKLKYQVRLEVEAELMKSANFQQFWLDLKNLAVTLNIVELIRLSYALQYVGETKSIKSKATKIKTHLDHANLPPDQREYVCKWERLYPYFKA
ncbi:hypothetical protein FAK_07590 [Desulfoferula mesophila]|uniref:Uncharacterized protein n=1 Tax=Desulfoferula mesophila TaxID=3058419 RepID=A0AAU9EVB3_9BACT|nr:hypothetical protein FAK_07590 [Desulfoferula mesophilus]